MLLMVKHFWPASVRLLKPAEDKLRDAPGKRVLPLNWDGLEVTTRALSFHNA